MDNLLLICCTTIYCIACTFRISRSMTISMYVPTPGKSKQSSSFVCWITVRITIQLVCIYVMPSGYIRWFDTPTQLPMRLVSYMNTILYDISYERHDLYTVLWWRFVFDNIFQIRYVDPAHFLINILDVRMNWTKRWYMIQWYRS